MRNKYIWLFALTVLAVISCLFFSRSQVCQEIPKPGHTPPIKRVLILGNSITRTDAVPSIGWYGNWGMAASKPEFDYFHRFTSRFAGSNIEVMTGNVSNIFEIKFWEFDAREMEKFRDFGADMIIMRLGENVNDTLAARKGFGNYLEQLIRYLRKSDKTVICCTNSFWPNKHINGEIERTCLKNGFIFVRLDDLFKDRSNMAIGRYENEAVSLHPSDKGMEKIADRLWQSLYVFF